MGVAVLVQVFSVIQLLLQEVNSFRVVPLTFDASYTAVTDIQ